MANPPEEPGRLQQTFLSTPLASHPSKWDSLWRDAYTPWDRGGPSLALSDLITSRPDLFPSSPATKKLRALVPGCGRGYDAVLLSVLGYDAVGLDYSAVAVEKAREKEGEMNAEEGGGEIGGGGEGGKVAWVRGDFFDDAWVEEVGRGRGFDLIFDYTFFCALPPEARLKWAARMKGLLSEDGRLVCLEWPLRKVTSSGGPPWGLSAAEYETHLSPGLKRLARVKPNRTHKAGTDGEGNVIDYISVWGHTKSD